MEDRPTARMLSALLTGRRLQLLVIGAQGTSSFLLPTSGSAHIGRAEDCEVRIDADTVSRRHAVIQIANGVMTLSDLGSANGTFVGGRRLQTGESAALSLGAVITFGAVTATVQAGPPSSQQRMLRTIEYLTTRIEEEIARASARSTSFAILSLRAPGDHADAVMQQILAERLRATDITASSRPGHYDNLLVDAEPGATRTIAAKIHDSLAVRGVEAAIGIARFPDDGRTPAELFAISRAHAPREPEPSPPVVPQLGVLERMRALVERVAKSDISVLVVGETGVGKELLSRMVHDLSERKHRPLVSINCAALDANLLESELFGHERGAFTGAVQAKPGLLESADGGTVFLDEIGEMAIMVQAKLLRVIETREVTRLGSVRPKTIDVRFVAATHRDLDAATASGRFREDLFFRLSGMVLVVPPLRERTNEIDQLATRFVEQACVHARRERAPRISDEALAALKNYSWPGNVRELRNVMDRAVLMCTGNVITLADLPMDRLGRRAAERPTMIPSAPTASHEPAPSKLARGFDGSEEERAKIQSALERAGGNQTLAAKMLGVSRGTLVARLERYGFPRPRKPGDG